METLFPTNKIKKRHKNRRSGLEKEKDQITWDIEKPEELGSYLLFVNREESINKLLKMTKEQYQSYQDLVRWNISGRNEMTLTYSLL